MNQRTARLIRRFTVLAGGSRTEYRRMKAVVTRMSAKRRTQMRDALAADIVQLTRAHIAASISESGS